MIGISSSYRTRLGSRGGCLLGAVAIALMPALATARAAGAAPKVVTCQTSWLASAGGSWSDAANWSAGVPTSSTNACITKAGTYTVHVTGVQNAAALDFGANNGAQTLSIEGTCDTESGELHLGASSTINPHGSVALTDIGDCDFSWLDQTVGTLTNDGTINVIDAGSTQDRFLYGDVDNAGAIHVGTTLKSDDGGHNVTNTGTVTVADGAAWLDHDSFANASGSLTTAGSGSFTELSGTFDQGNGTTTGSVFVQDGGLTYSGSGASTIVTHGEVDLSGDVAAGQSLRVEGTCEHGPGYLGVSAPWTNAGTVTLADTGDCQYAWLDQMSGTLTNTGTITISDTGTTQDRFIYGDLANPGTIAIDATLTSDDSGFTQTNTGTVSIADGAAWVDEDSFRNLGGSLTTSGTGAFDQVDGTFTQGAGTSTGTVVIDNAGLSYTGSGASTIAAHGAVDLRGNIAAGQTLTVEGACANGDSAEDAVVSAATPIANAGTLNLTDNGGCGSATFAQTSGALTNTGTIHAVNSGSAQHRQLLGTVSNAGLVVLDAGVDLSTGSGTFANESAGTIETHLAGTTKFGQLSDSGSVQLAGTLSIVRDGTYTPQTNRSFAVVTCATCSGTFTAVDGQTVNARSAFAVSETASGVTLTVLKDADLSLTGSAPASVASGSSFSFTFVVRNTGPKSASSVTLSDKLSTGMTFSSASAGCTRVGTQITCSLPNLGKTKSATVTITVVAGSAGKVTSTASVTASSFDPTPADNSSKLSVTIT